MVAVRWLCVARLRALMEVSMANSGVNSEKGRAFATSTRGHLLVLPESTTTVLTNSDMSRNTRPFHPDLSMPSGVNSAQCGV